MIRLPRMRATPLCVASLGFVLSTACVAPSMKVWAGSFSEEQRTDVFRELPAEASQSLISLSEIFYERIASRRFNSQAAFAADIAK